MVHVDPPKIDTKNREMKWRNSATKKNNKKKARPEILGNHQL